MAIAFRLDRVIIHIMYVYMTFEYDPQKAQTNEKLLITLQCC